MASAVKAVVHAGLDMFDTVLVHKTNSNSKFFATVTIHDYNTELLVTLLNSWHIIRQHIMYLMLRISFFVTR